MDKQIIQRIAMILSLSLSFQYSLQAQDSTPQAEFENYSATSKNYDSTRIPLGIDIIKNQLASLPCGISAVKLLDCGCGSGNYLIPLAEVVGHAYGIDLNQGMLLKARQKMGARKNISLQQGSLLALPYADASFNGLILNQVLHHLDSPETVKTHSNTRLFLHEAARVLTKDGLIIINGSTHEQWRDGFWFYSLLPAARDKLIARHIGLPALEAMLIEENFRIKEVITPIQEVLQGDDYFNPAGVLEKHVRDGDSTWGMASEKERSDALLTISQMAKQGTLMQFFRKRDALRKIIGQTVFIIAQKN